MKKVLKISLLAVMISVSAVASEAQEEPEKKDTGALMGMSIQKYLEGNIEQAITYLDEILTIEPDNERAKALLEKATVRMLEKTKEDTDEENLEFLKKARKHMPDSKELKKGISEAEKKLHPEVKEEPSRQVSATRTQYSAADAQQARQYQSRIRDLTESVRGLENKLNSMNMSEKEMSTKIEYLEETKSSLAKKVKEMSGIRMVLQILFALVILALGAAAVLINRRSLNAISSRLSKDLTKEKLVVEELKNSYNKDTEKLAQQLALYGKSYQRADDLEKNWARMIGIMERMTVGGSTQKLVLKDSPDGRKAVTGVDPRPRARADSVEIIEEIFRDSPKAPEMLRPFLDDSDNRTRANAAKAYYRYDPEKALAVLEGMSASEDKWMRLSAAWALGEIKDPNTSRLLEKLLEDPDIQVKNRARQSLEKILGQNRPAEGSQGNS
ncbi:MAG: HEAT repeat domain-containing protein [Elusimicrobia bacterium]|nr:HEAT repeat domain-containing protein [Elusimicrobiota bacterium]